MIEKIIDLIPTSIEKIKRNIVKYILLLLSLILFITPFIPFNMGKFSFDFNSYNSLSLFEYLLHYNQSVMFLLIALLLIIATMAVAVGQADASRILIPMNKCDNLVAGVPNLNAGKLIADAIVKLDSIINE